MMKHKNIYEKFMIEYDKAQIASSYPSLTKYEIATILDKAYLALISQKLTGNNPRLTPFEGDTKAIEDIRPLLNRKKFEPSSGIETEVSNEYIFNIPNDMLYYIQSIAIITGTINSIDNKRHVQLPTLLVSHNDANKFKNTLYNLPWILQPVVYIEGDYLHVLIDSYKYMTSSSDKLELLGTYIIKPNKFVNDSDDTEFELNDTMAEELINLAIIMSAEIVESLRLNTKINIRPLEA